MGWERAMISDLAGREWSRNLYLTMRTADVLVESQKCPKSSSASRARAAGSSGAAPDAAQCTAPRAAGSSGATSDAAQCTAPRTAGSSGAATGVMREHQVCEQRERP